MPSLALMDQRIWTRSLERSSNKRRRLPTAPFRLFLSSTHTLFSVSLCLYIVQITIFSVIMAGERIINRNPYLYGPGPFRRTPTGMGSYYAKLPPVQGFGAAAVHGLVLSLVGGLIYKFGFGNPQIKQIEDYYKENPPR